MSKTRENFIKAIKELPYDIDEELKHKNTLSLLEDVTQKYVELFGIDDLSADDKICIQNILTANNTQIIFQEKIN